MPTIVQRVIHLFRRVTRRRQHDITAVYITPNGMLYTTGHGTVDEWDAAWLDIGYTPGGDSFVVPDLT